MVAQFSTGILAHFSISIYSTEDAGAQERGDNSNLCGYGRRAETVVGKPHNAEAELTIRGTKSQSVIMNGIRGGYRAVTLFYS